MVVWVSVGFEYGEMLHVFVFCSSLRSWPFLFCFKRRGRVFEKEKGRAEEGVRKDFVSCIALKTHLPTLKLHDINEHVAQPINTAVAFLLFYKYSLQLISQWSYKRLYMYKRCLQFHNITPPLFEYEFTIITHKEMVNSLQLRLQSKYWYQQGIWWVSCCFHWSLNKQSTACDLCPFLDTGWHVAWPQLEWKLTSHVDTRKQITDTPAFN